MAAVDPIVQSNEPTGPLPIASEVDPKKTFQYYKMLVHGKDESQRLQELIDKETAALAEAKQAPATEAQRAHIHQLNNVLFRSGYEMDQILDDYRKNFGVCVQECLDEWEKLRNDWTQDDDQMFKLTEILAKAEFLKLHAKGMDVVQEVLPSLNGLLDDIAQFSSGHLSVGSLPDSALDHMSQIVVRLGDILGGAYEMAQEDPEWRGELTDPAPQSLTGALLNNIQNKIKQYITDYPAEIAKIQRLMPDGAWRDGLDIREEIYAFADILAPNGPLWRLPVKDILMFLDGNPDSRFRRAQMEKLKGDSAACKAWIETREKHEATVQQSVALAKEGNYLQSEELVGQLKPYFKDVKYSLYKETAKFWIDQREQLEKLLEKLTTDLKVGMNKIYSKPFLPMPRWQRMKKRITKTLEEIKKEAVALEKYAKTDFHKEAQPMFLRARSRVKEIEAMAMRRRRFCFLMALMEGGGVAAIAGSIFAYYLHSIERTLCSLNVNIMSDGVLVDRPSVDLGYYHSSGFHVKFTNLKAGTYPLEIRAPGYYSKSYSVTLETGSSKVMNNIELVPIVGHLHLGPCADDYQYEIHPLNGSGDEVDPVIRGQALKGEAKNIDLKSGRYRVYFKSDDKSFTVVEEISDEGITLFQPDFSFASLDIDTEPPGAQVSINGKKLGVTPFSTRLAPINYSLDVSLPGYQSYYSPLQLEPGSKNPLHLKLQPQIQPEDMDH